MYILDIKGAFDEVSKKSENSSIYFLIEGGVCIGFAGM